MANSSSKGITFVELVVACAVLVTIFVSFLYGLVGCIKLVNLSKETFFAIYSADAKIEEMRGHTFSDVYSYYTTSPQDTFEVDELPAVSSKGSIAIDNTNPELLEVYIAVCWKSFDGRVIGEDVNLDGNLAAAEDVNSNNKIDSPVSLATFITRR